MRNQPGKAPKYAPPWHEVKAQMWVSASVIAAYFLLALPHAVERHSQSLSSLTPMSTPADDNADLLRQTGRGQGVPSLLTLRRFEFVDEFARIAFTDDPCPNSEPGSRIFKLIS
jgi:hypothetical protein